jgi:glycosyltransferase involved in cell wall biosynthesis
MDTKAKIFNDSSDGQFNENKTATSQKNNLLSICIPTYNHAEPLEKSLESMIPQARRHNISIYVSDNASTDHTIKVLKSFQKNYPLLFFRSNKENLGIDQNMIVAALMASSKYIWVIGARRILISGMLDRVYRILEESDWDMVVLNDPSPVFKVPKTQRYTSAQRIFLELSRNLTGLGFEILPAEAWKSEVLQKYAGTDWTILGLSLEYIANKKDLNVFFLADPVATSTGRSKWIPRCFKVWTDLKKVVRSLPEVYPVADKERVIEYLANVVFVPRFNIMTTRRSLSLVSLRSEGAYNAKVFDNFREDLTKYAGYSPTLAYVIAKFPAFPIKLYFHVYDAIGGIARLFIHSRAKPINPWSMGNIPYPSE